MTQLLSIESAFLNASQVKSALNISEIKRLRTGELNATKKQFANSIAIGKVMANGHEWWNTIGQAMANEEGITWTTQDFFKKVYGYEKSYAHKMVKAARLDESVIEAFETKCLELIAKNKKCNYSIKGLIDYSKTGLIGTETQSEGGEGEEGEGGEGESVESVTTIFTMSMKSEGGNVAVRVDSQNVVKTKNSREEIEQAVAFLMASLEAE